MIRPAQRANDRRPNRSVEATRDGMLAVSGELDPRGGGPYVPVGRNGEGDVVIEVSNWGAAIPAESLPRLFDRFYRADPSRSGHGGQTGLGLAIVKSIVEAHGGALKALVPEEGPGLQMIFTLPLSREAPGQMARPISDKDDV